VIIVVTTNSHRYTHEKLATVEGLDLKVVSYVELREQKPQRPATYIFTDIDRLAPDLLLHMSKIYRQLRDEGHRVLNDPVRTLGRFGLLRALNRAGINDFDCYRADELSTPKRWPVFLRVEGNHGEPLSGLLENEKQLKDAVDESRDGGTPIKDLLIIEYLAEPVRPGVFRKLSVFKLGERLIGFPSVHEDNWLVKYGAPGLADETLYEEDYGFVADNPFLPLMSRVFGIAGVDYGRVDFGLVDGRPQIYEINTNPDVKLRPQRNPNARRNETIDLFREKYLDAMQALDPTGAHRPIAQPGSVR